MKKITLLLAFLLSTAVVYWLLGGPRPVPQDKIEAIRDFLKTTVAESLKRDYRSHGMTISVLVTNVTIDRITKKETDQDNVYFTQGRVSYIIKGRRMWRDKEGNLIHLGPEQEITHWFSCGILEDRYMGALIKDDRNRLQFYADNPAVK